MKNEKEIKNKIIKDIDEKIQSLKEQLNQYKSSKERYLKEEPSEETIFAHGQAFDFDEEVLLMVKVGMSFCNKYGERGTITKLNEDRESVQAINFDTKEEESFSIERFTSCGFYELKE